MKENIGCRIKKLREQKGLSQRSFADKTDIGQSTIAMFETGNRNPKDIHIKRICTEFGVNEIWLRTGEGGVENMFTKMSPEDRYAVNLGKLMQTKNEFLQNAVNALAEADTEQLKTIENFMKKCLGVK